MQIRTRELGLAAFIKMSGNKLVDYNNRVFVFESGISLGDWRVKYLNSCCYKHDQELCALRKFVS